MSRKNKQPELDTHTMILLLFIMGYCLIIFAGYMYGEARYLEGMLAGKLEVMNMLLERFG